MRRSRGRGPFRRSWRTVEGARRTGDGSPENHEEQLGGAARRRRPVSGEHPGAEMDDAVGDVEVVFVVADDEQRLARACKLGQDLEVEDAA